MDEQAKAFKELLGLGFLPQSGQQARDAARQLSALILAGLEVPPGLSQAVAHHLSRSPPVKPRFVDVSTGLRLRYLEWGCGGDVILLLHDLGEAAEVWAPLGRRLADRGYRVLALDLRGHGESQGSPAGRYSADSLAEDVRAFILALDLYVAPLALVGAGAGAAAALALAQANPYLAGALMLVEFALPVAHLECFGSQGAAQAASGVAVPSGDDASAGNTDVGQTCCQPGISSPGDPAAEKFSSTQLLPWWGFRAGQASVFASVEHCAAFLAHPLANLSPQLLAPLARATQRMLAAAAAADGGPDGRTGQPSAAAGGGADQQGVAAAAAQAEEAAYMGHLLAQLQRPLGGVVASALSMLRVPAALRAGSCWGGEAEDAAGLRPRMDPAMLFSFDPAALLGGMSALRGHLLLLHGGGTASWVDPGDAGALVQLARGGGGVASTAVQVVPGAGHHLAADHPEQLLQHLIEFLEGPAINCFDRSALAAPGGGAIAGSPAAAHPSGACAAVAAAHDAAAAGGRRAELLGLRPLPQYATLEEAKKALGPRAIPTAAAVEEELRRLRLEDGRPPDDCSSEDEEAVARGRQQTALAKDPADYFGFVG